MMDERSGLFDQPKIVVVRAQEDSVLRSCSRRFIEKLQELRAFDTEKYVDMLVGDQIDIPSDHHA